jgi:hypothetical protein
LYGNIQQSHEPELLFVLARRRCFFFLTKHSHHVIALLLLSVHHIDATSSIDIMLTTKPHNKNTFAVIHGGSKTCVGVPPSLTKSRASRDDLLISDITNGIVNIELKEPKFLPNMGQTSFDEQFQADKKVNWNGKSKKSFNDTNNRSIGGGSSTHCKGKRVNKGRKKNYPDERLQQGWDAENGASSRNKENVRLVDDVARPSTSSYEWLDRINQNQHGIQGVVFLNDLGQPVVEYLPQEGFEYRVVLKVTSDGRKGKKKAWPKDAQCCPLSQNQQQVSQGIFASHVLPGCPVFEGTVVSSAGANGFLYAPPGYSPYMYSLYPPQQGHPMMMHPPTPSHYGAQNDVVYAGYHQYTNEHHFYQPPYAGLTNAHNEPKENYDQIKSLPPPLPLDDHGRAEENARRVSLEPRLARQGNCCVVPSVSPIP